ncbi:MAG: hypothetical protein FH759_11025 [Sediminimonas qiaohouensis]|uniref:Alpha 1,4-glycosyltransferase domain-containing protein n=1 Tax=Sediminimonas qiaohouensis TaxID=552061 RepID=A0A7C9HCR6_9RHOB|nr:hypothetical protein [Sediminimonas qiaohouensis]MTJ05207.1 hypothetical protein [Sediminimonas qiaohouensis]
MAREREVGTLWIGGALSWMEQLCLKSFVDQGQKITLFSYEEIPNVPEGVIHRDGREVIDTDDFIKYESKDSFALFADLFRLHMIKQNPGMIWIDTDVYCHRPMEYDSDYVMGFELPGEYRVNNAVLGLPADSLILNDMLSFTEDRYSVAPFLPKKKQKEFRAAREAGHPVHVSQQPWGVWGPMMVTHFTHAHGLTDKVQPLDAFYPVTFRNRMKFLQRASVAEGMISERTTALHLWASNKREMGKRHDGLPPKGSYLEMLTARHGIRVREAPLKGRGKSAFQGGLVDEITLDQVESFADLSGQARSLALAAHGRFDCQVQIVDVNNEGQPPEKQSEWVDEYRQFLLDNEVPKEKISIIRDLGALRPVDVLANLRGFGDGRKVKYLKPFLDGMMHSDTQMFMDIRKGSGAFPFLRDYGESEILSTREENAKEVRRVRFARSAPSIVQNDDTWDAIARRLAGEDGFYRPGPEGHSFLYVPRSRDTLVVTFDNLDITMTKREDRRPWGYSFIEAQGWSMLGVLAGGWTWYREPWVAEQFDDLRDSGFFKQFKRVVFYGASMGGYAACAFSPAAPGADVVAISPQSTVDKSVVPWESRYKAVWDRDFTGRYGDAAEVSRAARRVSILYDPYEPLDASHAARFTNDNVQHLRAPLLGHRLGTSLQQMGILNPIILGALSGDLGQNEYYRLLRARRDAPRYQRELFNRAVESGHKRLARRLGEWVLTRNENPAVRRGLRKL